MFGKLTHLSQHTVKLTRYGIRRRCTPFRWALGSIGDGSPSQETADLLELDERELSYSRHPQHPETALVERVSTIRTLLDVGQDYGSVASGRLLCRCVEVIEVRYTDSLSSEDERNSGRRWDSTSKFPNLI